MKTWWLKTTILFCSSFCGSGILEEFAGQYFLWVSSVFSGRCQLDSTVVKVGSEGMHGLEVQIGHSHSWQSMLAIFWEFRWGC